MAVTPIPILTQATAPIGVAGAFRSPYSVYSTNGTWPGMVWVFDNNGLLVGMTGRFRVPVGYVSGAQFILVWTATSSTGNIPWRITSRKVDGNDQESFDQLGEDSETDLLTPGPTTANNRMQTIVTPPPADFTAGATIQFGIFRDGLNAGESMAAEGLLFDAYFDYSDV